ncbi:ribonuclease H-like domain-containing protein [Tanacetum coccineum]
MVRSMWLFKHKFHADGTLSRYKARLVVNGSSQQLGVDFDETFCPVVKPATIRTVLSLVVSRRWHIHQLDVKNAFLNGDLSKTVYMHQPPGFVDNRYPHHIVFLQRSLCDETSDPGQWVSAAFILYAYSLPLWIVNTMLIVAGLCQTTPGLTSETAWLRNLLRELHSPLSTATLVSIVITLVEVSTMCPSRFQYADIFTKGLPSALFEEFRSSLSVRPPPAPTAGTY